MNYHSDTWILNCMQEHREESLDYFKEENIVGIFLQGSQNYGLDFEDSDIDTKLIVTPSFKDICLNKKPMSTTHVRLNDEHTDWKDIRLYMETFRKQNLNFLEILFTNFYWINPLYEKEWDRLIEAREDIARMNPYRAVKSMKGIALEKYHAMEHPYPSKEQILTEWGYDPKQLHHLLRVKEYLERYITGEYYKSCLRPHNPQYLVKVKKGFYTLDEARLIADSVIAETIEMADKFCANFEDKENVAMKELLEDVSYNIMKISVEKELSV